MARRYLVAMRVRPSFALLSALLLIMAGEAAAQVRATAVASARIIERPVRIVAAELQRPGRNLPPQAQISQRGCDPGAPPRCRMIIIDLP
jgi:hypothetical protein